MGGFFPSMEAFSFSWAAFSLDLFSYFFFFWVLLPPVLFVRVLIPQRPGDNASAALRSPDGLALAFPPWFLKMDFRLLFLLFEGMKLPPFPPLLGGPLLSLPTRGASVRTFAADDPRCLFWIRWTFRLPPSPQGVCVLAPLVGSRSKLISPSSTSLAEHALLHYVAFLFPLADTSRNGTLPILAKAQPTCCKLLLLAFRNQLFSFGRIVTPHRIFVFLRPPTFQSPASYAYMLPYPSQLSRPLFGSFSPPHPLPFVVVSISFLDHRWEVAFST